MIGFTRGYCNSIENPSCLACYKELGWEKEYKIIADCQMLYFSAGYVFVVGKSFDYRLCSEELDYECSCKNA